MSDHDQHQDEQVTAADVPTFDGADLAAADLAGSWDISTHDTPGQTLLEFDGPAMTFNLPSGTTVEAVVGPDGREVPFVQDGTVLARRNAHFGRGRWTVRSR